MLHKLYFPKPPLSQFVENIWYYKGLQVEYSREKILPDGAIELIIDLDDWPKKIFNDESSEEFRSCKKGWIAGERSQYIVIGAESSSMMGVHFRPGGTYPFFRFPISELNDQVIELDLIWGSLVHDIRDQLLEIESPDGKLLALEAFLLARAQCELIPKKTIAYAVRQLQSPGSFIPIRDLANRIGISQKHLISQFDKFVGLSPKAFQRVSRFQRVLNVIEQQQAIEWSAIANECGYFDQAHFIREFHSFSGVNPSSYLTQRGDYVGYIPLR
jgi:AraC-like DNA-binding protein